MLCVFFEGGFGWLVMVGRLWVVQTSEQGAQQAARLFATTLRLEEPPRREEKEEDS